MTDYPIDPIAIDVGELLQKTVTSLYSHLVTRPTGRAVRMAIETRLQGTGERSLSVIDLSEVVIIDFSCADEVVAKLLQRYRDNKAVDAFFVFRGVHEPHRDQIEVVLERQGLAAVAEIDTGSFRLLGVCSDREGQVWSVLEDRGLIGSEEIETVFQDGGDRSALNSLVERRLVFRSPISGRIHALSRLVQQLM